MATGLDDTQLDATFAALSDATRRAILAGLASGEATVNELAEPFAMSQPAVSKHLKVLERCGLITRSRQAQFRPCHLQVAGVESTVGWVAEQRRIWNDRFDQLDAHLAELQGRPGDGTGSDA